MRDDFFDIIGMDEDDGTEAARTPRTLSSVQYAMRTCLRPASSLMQVDRYVPPVMAPSQVLGMLVDACRLEPPYDLHQVSPSDMRARGTLMGVELAVYREVRPLEALGQECRDAMRAHPVSKAEQERIQSLIHAAADARGGADTDVLRMVAFMAIRLFVMSDAEGRALPDACWFALVAGMLSGFDDAAREGLSIRSGLARDLAAEIKSARASDDVQASVSATKDAVLPADAGGAFAWAMTACAAAGLDAACEEGQAKAIVSMATSYALPIALSQAREAFDIACEADGTSEGDIVRRLAVAMHAHALGRSHGSRTHGGSVIQFDPTRGLSADMAAVTLYGAYWLCGYASEAVGWSWDQYKARHYEEDILGDWWLRPSRSSYANDMREGYEEAWQAGERGRVRIHRLFTTPQTQSIAERLSNAVRPMGEKFHSLGYAATFLYVPAATPNMPYLLP